MRIFAAVLLLGNVEFVEGTGLELDIVGNNGKLYQSKIQNIEKQEISHCKTQF
jgi:hypothetical protein